MTTDFQVREIGAGVFQVTVRIHGLDNLMKLINALLGPKLER